MYNEPLVSVVVPIYNIDNKLLERCVHSILKQTYHNIEIILVDDATNEENKKIINDFIESYENIRKITHEKNRGLFQTRISGVKASSASKYICFVDADDYVTIDWVRLLVSKSEQEHSDITMAQFIVEDEEKKQYIYNLSRSFCKNRSVCVGRDIFKLLVENEGRFFGIHTMWNKLYTIELWNKVLPELEKYQKNFVMTEDIAFSFVLFYYAKRMAFSAHDGYFYYRNANSSTLNNGNFTTIRKNVEDIQYSFDQTHDFLEQHDVLQEYANNLAAWKDRYFRFWSMLVERNTVSAKPEQKEFKKKFMSYFGKTEPESTTREDSVFTENHTFWNSRLEELKIAIASEETKVVSFDVFDTLVLRPVLQPEDVFELMQWEMDYESSEHFKTFRQLSESGCRKQKHIINPEIEDVTIEEIYDFMERNFQVSSDVCMKWMDWEKAIEIRISRERKIGKELFELAQYLGKRVILVSDMYLDKETMTEILARNGYTSYEMLFLSSERKKLKATGHLYDVVLDTYREVEPEQILHIGDNWEADHIVVDRKGIKSFFLPKAKDILFNTLGDKYTGNAVNCAVDNRNSIIDVSGYMKKLPVRCLYAAVANELFDDPFCSFNEGSDYNGDPYMLGAFPVGMHMFGIAKWLLEDCTFRRYKKICFTARDGYYLKRMYDLLRLRCKPDAPSSEYVYVSRRSLVPVEIESKGDLLKIIDNIVWNAQTPGKLLETYAAILKPLTPEMIKTYADNGFIMNSCFGSREGCIAFLKLMGEISFSEDRHKATNEALCRYLKGCIGPNDAIFDLGYSGKIQGCISKAVGHSVDGYYLHHNGYEAMMRAKHQGFQIYSFYEFAPSMSGVVNEFIFSDYRPSCIGYDLETYSPVLQDKLINYMDVYVLEEIARASLHLVNNLLDSFENHMEFFCLNGIDSGLQYEKLLMSAKLFDRKTFSCCKVEDQYYGGIQEREVCELWEWQMYDRGIGISAERNISESRNLPSEIYADGVLVKTFHLVGRVFPLGSRRREVMKRVIGVFVR